MGGRGLAGEVLLGNSTIEAYVRIVSLRQRANFLIEKQIPLDVVLTELSLGHVFYTIGGSVREAKLLTVLRPRTKAKRLTLRPKI